MNIEYYKQLISSSDSAGSDDIEADEPLEKIFFDEGLEQGIKGECIWVKTL